ncbi:NhaP-type Na+/H+ or K+/H+ antiporter [Arthrobacter pigmenti]|uniref:NhaP-type Na+/H+ or K+/H+ antiporter n=1 Tax=Arthrobacter pigmenti TaxID=271432 RepID=A0A846RVF0_9MICC|nr:NhaP-type Na+/H+ or K+/H+ antiporter [Arthrobacter pigmenti]
MLKLFEGPSIIYTILGIVVFAAALLPRLLRRAPISMPMVFLGGGVLAFALIDYLPTPDPVKYEVVTTHLTEVCVIISLMGAGLALDRPLGWRGWSTTWRLLAIVMPVCILVLAWMGYVFLGLGLASALLVAAALAPTDPVLASEVQVGEPADGEEGFDREDEVRFGLTSEAGLNDGLAFPFVYLAISISLVGVAPSEWFPQWFLIDVLWRIGFGVLLGYGTGKLLGRLFFSARSRSFRLSNHSEGFVALAATFLAYGVTETFEGYGFVAVFVCAITIRAAERDHGYHRVLHSYVEQLERLLSVVILVLLGGAIARGLLETIGWTDVVLALVFLLLVRPLAGYLGLLGGHTGTRDKVALAFFGVRGIGSLYYIGYGLSNGEFTAEANEVWAFVGLVVALSVVLHGVSATPVMRALDRVRRREAARHGDEREAPHTAV